MGYEERNAWSGLVLSIIAVGIYTALLLAAAAGGPVAQVDWVPLMLWTIGLGIVAAIIVSITWGLLVRRRDGGVVSDQRDRDIAHVGSRVGQAFLVLAGLGVIVLCAFRVDWFWIAQTMFYGFALSSIVGGVASVILYRRGLV